MRNLAVYLAISAVVALTSFRMGQKSLERENRETAQKSNQLDLSLMWKVKDRLAEMFLEKDKMNDKDMVYGAIKGMVDSLSDPYTVFLPPKENKNSNEDLSGEFGGVGIQLGYKEKTLAVMTPLPKTPAARAGVLAGDLILKIIDKEKGLDKDTSGLALGEAVEMIRGKEGTQVTLKLYREGGKESFEVTLTREKIVVPSLELEWKEKDGKKVAWIKLYKFSEQLYKDWPGVVEGILKKKAADFGGIVLDLRNNPGGYLQASVLVASDFLDKGVVVKQQSSDGNEQVYHVEKDRRRLLTEKLVILVNGGSASAAEILAGALKEYGRGKLVGEKTFGKGTVQQPQDFRDGSGLHVTVAKWLLPSGKNIHKEGVTVDIEATISAKIQDEEVKGDSQLDKAIEVLLEE